MSEKVINVRIKSAYKTSSQWSTQNPILKLGEVGYVSDKNNIYKVGDGVTNWNSLPYANGGDTSGTSGTQVLVSGGTAPAYWTSSVKVSSASLADSSNQTTGKLTINQNGSLVTSFNGSNATANLTDTQVATNPSTANMYLVGSTNSNATTSNLNLTTAFSIKDDTLSGSIISLGTSADMSDKGIQIVNIRTAETIDSTAYLGGLRLANFFGTNAFGPRSSYNYTGLHLSGMRTTYSSWELVKYAGTNSVTDPLYVRGSYGNTSWGDWVKIYDENNPPSSSEISGLGSMAAEEASSYLGTGTSATIANSGRDAATAYVSSNYLPATSPDRGLDITNKKIGHTNSVPSGQTSTVTQTPDFNATFAIPSIAYDNHGHVTSTTTASVKIPSTSGLARTSDIPTVGEANVSISVNGSSVGSFNVNQTTSSDINIPLASTAIDGAMSIVDFKKINPQAIPNGTDLNTITDIGWYYCSTSTNISTLVNKPQNGVRMYMEVMSTGGGSRYQHIVIQGTAGATAFRHWHRICYSSGGTVTWKDWVEWELTDTDTKVEQTATTTKSYLTGNAGSASTTSGLNLSTAIYFEGSTVTANTFNGTATSASNADKLDGYDSSAFVKKSGDTMTGSLTIAPTTSNTGSLVLGTTDNLQGIRVLYTNKAGAYDDPLNLPTSATNFVMGSTTSLGGINGDLTTNTYYSGMYIRPFGGNYSPWMIMGRCTNVTSSYTTANYQPPLLTRHAAYNLNTNAVEWGPWRQIYDSFNPPSSSDLGLGSMAYKSSADYLSSATKYALSTAVGGVANEANKVSNKITFVSGLNIFSYPSTVYDGSLETTVNLHDIFTFDSSDMISQDENTGVIIHNKPVVNGTSGVIGPTAATTLDYGSSFNVPYIEYDKWGHIVGSTSNKSKNISITLPDIPSSVSKATSATRSTYATSVNVSSTSTTAWRTPLGVGIASGDTYDTTYNRKPYITGKPDETATSYYPFKYRLIAGTTSDTGIMRLDLGNSVASSVVGNARGQLSIAGTGNRWSFLVADHSADPGSSGTTVNLRYNKTNTVSSGTTVTYCNNIIPFGQLFEKTYSVTTTLANNIVFTFDIPSDGYQVPLGFYTIKGDSNTYSRLTSLESRGGVITPSLSVSGSWLFSINGVISAGSTGSTTCYLRLLFMS